MSAALTVHAGNPGESDVIEVVWFDQDNAQHRGRVEIVTVDRDKPRTVYVRVEGLPVEGDPRIMSLKQLEALRPADRNWMDAERLACAERSAAAERMNLAATSPFADTLTAAQAENTRLVAEVDRLRAENARLLEQNNALRQLKDSNFQAICRGIDTIEQVHAAAEMVTDITGPYLRNRGRL